MSLSSSALLKPPLTSGLHSGIVCPNAFEAKIPLLSAFHAPHAVMYSSQNCCQAAEILYDHKSGYANATDIWHRMLLTTKHCYTRERKQSCLCCCTADDLIKHKCNIHATDKNKATALHIAATHGNAPFVNMLLQHGARVQDNGPGYTPLHAACKASCSEAVWALVDSGPSINEQVLCPKGLKPF